MFAPKEELESGARGANKRFGQAFSHLHSTTPEKRLSEAELFDNDSQGTWMKHRNNTQRGRVWKTDTDIRCRRHERKVLPSLE